MTDKTRQPPGEGKRPAELAAVVRRFWRVGGGFFQSEERWAARGMLALVVLLSVAQMLVQIRLNAWNAEFFDALERRDASNFLLFAGMFVVWVALSAIVTGLQVQVRMGLQLRWRTWLTRRLLARWLDQGRHYLVAFLPGDHRNPDQRIADDVRLSVEAAVDFLNGILDNLLLLLSFVGILWLLSGSLEVTLESGNTLVLPGYMVFAAILYALTGSLIAWMTGRPLVRRNLQRFAAEGDFRLHLIRVQEAAEGVALLRGEADERAALHGLFGTVAQAWRGLILVIRRVTGFTTAYNLVAVTFPIAIASPKYFTGAITLGGLMQIANAFTQVQKALSWFIDNFARFSEWTATVNRVGDLADALDMLEHDRGIDAERRIEVAEGEADDRIVLDDVSIAYPDGIVVVHAASAELLQGERTLIVAGSGTGKSTLVRAIAGIWPWGAGRIVLPKGKKLLFLPQRPYLPSGSLRRVLAYPADPEGIEDEAFGAALSAVGLDGLTARLADVETWDRALSLGEQQRLAFARVLLQRPDWVFLDEALVSLDRAGEEQMMALFDGPLAGTGVVSVGHASDLARYHQRTLELVPGAEGFRLVRAATPPESAAERVVSLWRRLFGGRRAA
jgi:putative ATP-binding cassette transporter